jgi:hypothetical protein
VKRFNLTPGGDPAAMRAQTYIDTKSAAVSQAMTATLYRQQR